jgi:hypothetical protein
MQMREVYTQQHQSGVAQQHIGQVIVKSWLSGAKSTSSGTSRARTWAELVLKVQLVTPPVLTPRLEQENLPPIMN